MSMKFLTLDNLTKIVEKFKSIFVKLKSDGLAEIDGLYSPGRDQYFTLGDPEKMEIDIPEGKTCKILADQEWVTTKISEAELEGKDVDLTPYLKKAEAETTYLKPGGVADKLHVENLPEVDMVSPTGGGDNEYSYLRGDGTPLLNNLCYLDLAIENIEQTYLLEDQFAEKLNELLGGELEGYLKESDAASNEEVADTIDNAINDATNS